MHMERVCKPFLGVFTIKPGTVAYVRIAQINISTINEGFNILDHSIYFASGGGIVYKSFSRIEITVKWNLITTEANPHNVDFCNLYKVPNNDIIHSG